MSFSSDIKQELNKTNSLINKESVKFELIGYCTSGNTDVIKGKNGYRVVVNNQSPAKVGDKLTQREGNKSTVSQIIPVDQMPRTKDGRPLDILINDLSIPSRQNAALMYEILLGKIAEKTGKEYRISE